MTDLQTRAVSILKRSPNQTASCSQLAVRLKISRVAVASSMRSLERLELVSRFRGGNDQWAPLCWRLRDDMRGMSTRL